MPVRMGHLCNDIKSLTAWRHLRYRASCVSLAHGAAPYCTLRRDHNKKDKSLCPPHCTYFFLSKVQGQSLKIVFRHVWQESPAFDLYTWFIGKVFNIILTSFYETHSNNSVNLETFQCILLFKQITRNGTQSVKLLMRQLRSHLKIC